MYFVLLVIQYPKIIFRGALVRRLKKSSWFLVVIIIIHFYKKNTYFLRYSKKHSKHEYFSLLGYLYIYWASYFNSCIWIDSSIQGLDRNIFLYLERLHYHEHLIFLLNTNIYAITFFFLYIMYIEEEILTDLLKNHNQYTVKTDSYGHEIFR